MPNVKRIIEGNNRKLFKSNTNAEEERKCNCPRSTICPLEGECLAKDVVYQATVTCGDKEETHVGLNNSYNLQIKTRKPKSIIENETETKFDGTKQAYLESNGKFYAVHRIIQT